MEQARDAVDTDVAELWANDPDLFDDPGEQPVWVDPVIGYEHAVAALVANDELSWVVWRLEV